MFSLFRRPAPAAPPPGLEAELQALCTAHQFEALSVPARLRRDIGLDCGCAAAAPGALRR